MLRCLASYINRQLGLYAEPGDLVERGPDLEAWLLRDSPGSFERVEPSEPEVRAPETPPRDKMLRRAPARKAPERQDRQRTPNEGAMGRADHPGLARPKPGEERRG